MLWCDGCSIASWPRLSCGEGSRPTDTLEINVHNSQHYHNRSHCLGGRHQHRCGCHGHADSSTYAGAAGASSETGRRQEPPHWRRRCRARHRKPRRTTSKWSRPGRNERCRSGLSNSVTSQAHRRASTSVILTRPPSGDNNLCQYTALHSFVDFC